METKTTFLRRKYSWTAGWYDTLDYPWERIYRRWRPLLVGDMRGHILEAGVGTGRNLSYYAPGNLVIGLDLSEAMLSRATQRAKACPTAISLIQADALNLPFQNASFDAYLSTFLYCVLPDQLQSQALIEMSRVLVLGGMFRLLEIVYSKHSRIRLGQILLAPLVERLYGARFDRRTLSKIEGMSSLDITGTRFLKDDTYLLIEGRRRAD